MEEAHLACNVSSVTLIKMLRSVRGALILPAWHLAVCFETK